MGIERLVNGISRTVAAIATVSLLYCTSAVHTPRTVQLPNRMTDKIGCRIRYSFDPFALRCGDILFDPAKETPYMQSRKIANGLTREVRESKIYRIEQETVEIAGEWIDGRPKIIMFNPPGLATDDVAIEFDDAGDVIHIGIVSQDGYRLVR